MDKGPRDPNFVDPSSINPSSVFPADFAWGVATSSHQVEGGNANNQWAEWEKRGRIKSKDCVGQACDWWLNAEQDFDLAKSLGVNALRLSVEWSRIEPQEGIWDETALARYREMLQALHARGMRPFVTLHHFTNPQWFEEKQAFASPDSVRLFERFTQRVVAALGDLCRDWPRLTSQTSMFPWDIFWVNFLRAKKGGSLKRRTLPAICVWHMQRLIE
jgi:beta-glucosidase